MSGNWGSYLQGGQMWEEINQLGIVVSKYLHESVHYPAYNKPNFECECGAILPVWVVRGAVLTGFWEAVDKLHEEGKIIAERSKK